MERSSFYQHSGLISPRAPNLDVVNGELAVNGWLLGDRLGDYNIRGTFVAGSGYRSQFGIWCACWDSPTAMVPP